MQQKVLSWPIRLCLLVPPENPWWSKILSVYSPARAWSWVSPVSRRHTWDSLVCVTSNVKNIGWYFNITEIVMKLVNSTLARKQDKQPCWVCRRWEKPSRSGVVHNLCMAWLTVGASESHMHHFTISIHHMRSRSSHSSKNRDAVQFLKVRGSCNLWIWDWIRAVSRPSDCPHVQLVLGQNWYFSFPICISRSRFSSHLASSSDILGYLPG